MQQKECRECSEWLRQLHAPCPCIPALPGVSGGARHRLCALVACVRAEGTRGRKKWEGKLTSARAEISAGILLLLAAMSPPLDCLPPILVRVRAACVRSTQATWVLLIAADRCWNRSGALILQSRACSQHYKIGLQRVKLGDHHDPEPKRSEPLRADELPMSSTVHHTSRCRSPGLLYVFGQTRQTQGQRGCCTRLLLPAR